MSRKVPPPDFRYVWLTPGSTSPMLAVAAGTAGLGALGVALQSVGLSPASIGVALTGGAAVLYALGRGDAAVAGRFGAREVPMAIVPWGVLIDPYNEARVLRWPAIRKVSVHVSHAMRGGTPSIVSTLVMVRTYCEVLAGRTVGAAGLEDLTVNLEGYAEESARPVARDLDGIDECGDGATEPVIPNLLRAAAALFTTASGAARLGLPAGGYRTVASRIAAPETLAVLGGVLANEEAGEASADARPLAAIVAAQLDAYDLLPQLVRLVSSPHPVVAAVARAAALRLGASKNRVGAIEEVSPFLFEEDFAALSLWLDPTSAA